MDSPAMTDPFTAEDIEIAAKKICCPHGCEHESADPEGRPGEVHQCHAYQCKGVAGLVLSAVAPRLIAAEREACAKAVDHSICDVAEDVDLFMAHRDFFAAAIRARADAKEGA